jgi:hypothetical protein
MKKAFLLCAVIGVALVLGACANQNSSATTTASRLPPESGVVGGGGVGPGGGGPASMPKSLP